MLPAPPASPTPVLPLPRPLPLFFFAACPGAAVAAGMAAGIAAGQFPQRLGYAQEGRERAAVVVRATGPLTAPSRHVPVEAQRL